MTNIDVNFSKSIVDSSMFKLYENKLILDTTVTSDYAYVNSKTIINVIYADINSIFNEFNKHECNPYRLDIRKYHDDSIIHALIYTMCAIDAKENKSDYDYYRLELLLEHLNR